MRIPRVPRLLPHRFHRPIHRFIHEQIGFSYGPHGYFGCRVCDKDWVLEHPEDRDLMPRFANSSAKPSY